MEGSSQSLERRQEGAAVKAIPIPRELQQQGVFVGRDEESGMAVVVIPPQVRQALNVINPVSSFAQADPNWTPAISLVQLDKNLHSYRVAGKNGLNKQALETLAKAAGVLYTRTERVPKETLHEGELWAYRATVGFRRSDGTIEHVTRERGFNAEVERAEIETAVKTKTRYQSQELEFQTPEAIEAEIKKRWINELRFGPAKTESKAINRALRAGLQIPTSLPDAAFAKPFLVIGYNFTPDYDDAETKRLLIAAGLNAETAVYGTGQRELEAGSDAAEGYPPSDTAGGEGDEPETPSADAREQAGGRKEAEEGEPATTEPASTSPAAGSSSAEPEPDLDDEDEGIDHFAIPAKVIDDAGAFQTSKGKAVAEIAAQGEKGAAWLLWALRNLPEGEERAAIATFVENREPELWARFQEIGE